MSSKRRRESSQANGRKSRGPITPEGKARSSENALRHGFLSSQVVLPNQSEEQFQILFHEYAEPFPPRGRRRVRAGRGNHCVLWRTRRAWAIEKESFSEAIAGRACRPRTRPPRRAWRRLAADPETALLHRYETLLHQRFNRALQNWLVFQKIDRRNEPSPEIRTVTRASRRRPVRRRSRAD